MSSFSPQLQNSAASVTSITISVVAMKATSPESRPNPLSIYCEKIARKRSTTPVPPMSILSARLRRRRLRRRSARHGLITYRGVSVGVLNPEETAALFGPGGTAIGRGQRELAHLRAGPELRRQRIAVRLPDARGSLGTHCRLLAQLHERHGDSEAYKNGCTGAREDFAIHGGSVRFGRKIARARRQKAP